MSYFSGRDGAMYMEIAGSFQKVAKATSWQLSSSQSSLDTTTLEDTDRTVISGLRATTGSCSILYYQDSRGDNTSNRCSQLIDKLIKPRHSTGAGEEGKADEAEVVRMRFAVNDGSGTMGRYTEIDAVLTSASMEMGVGAIFQASVSFDVIGAPRSVSI